jgi:hypothetical protein
MFLQLNERRYSKKLLEKPFAKEKAEVFKIKKKLVKRGYVIFFLLNFYIFSGIV